MKRFTPLQKITLAVLSAIVVVLAVVAFATGRSIDPEPVNISASPTATPEIVYIGLADPTPSPIPIPAPTPSPAVPTGAASPTAAQPTAKPTVANGDAFTLTIRKQNIGVASGVEESTLEDGPGWLATSAAPGQEGVCVVYGHRNRNHLKVLEKVDYGDAITVTAKDGTQYSYKVESIEIIASDKELRIPTLDGAHLMLVTCYPFYYSGHAPQKYVVTAYMT